MEFTICTFYATHLTRIDTSVTSLSRCILHQSPQILKMLLQIVTGIA